MHRLNRRRYYATLRLWWLFVWCFLIFIFYCFCQLWQVLVAIVLIFIGYFFCCLFSSEFGLLIFSCHIYYYVLKTGLLFRLFKTKNVFFKDFFREIGLIPQKLSRGSWNKIYNKWEPANVLLNFLTQFRSITWIGSKV